VVSATDKIEFFQRLFRGRTDAYPVRWESKSGKSGYSPACANEWQPLLCDKPRIKCADCPNRAFLAVTDEVVRQHLTGRIVAGVYPLLPDDQCYFLAMDFDGEDWREDVASVRTTGEAFDVPFAVEISRSGDGAHLWIFFDGAVPARDARRLGTALLSHTCARRRVLQLGSYDRLFPNQDRMPKGGFGNLIALPLQRGPRDRGHSVFVDSNWIPWPDQWAFLAALGRMAESRIEAVIDGATGGAHPLDVAFITEEDEAEPWKRRGTPPISAADVPAQVRGVVANALYIEKQELSAAFINRLIRLAAFQNPEFYRAQAMRFPVWNKPRVIGCATDHPRHLALPRGCRDAVEALCGQYGVPFNVTDERMGGDALDVRFRGTLREDQQRAVTALLVTDTGVLVAPTGFGKTVVAAAIIAARQVNTVILVHRQELQRQWMERLATFLEGPGVVIGSVGGGKSRLGGRIDVAVLQSLAQNGEGTSPIERYGQVIVDECHHVSAMSFEAVLKAAPARYVLGLTATPIRRDGMQPIITMQCGAVRHVAVSPTDAPQERVVYRHLLPTRLDVADDAPIQAVLGLLSADTARNGRIASDIVAAYRAGRSCLVLTERTQHLDALVESVAKDVPDVIVLHGRLGPRERQRRLEALQAMSGTAPRVVVSTGKLVGEGFDHAPLDTLFLAMPVSWKGTLQQYAGRLSRAHASKTRVVIHDYLDADIPVLARMWKRRSLGYRAIGFVLKEEGAGSGLLL
jgi:superfamily II DNA or RNA helicase